MAFRAVNSPAVHRTWVLVYRGSSGYTRIAISQGKTNLTQTSKTSRFAMFSKSVKNLLPYRFLSLTTLVELLIFSWWYLYAEIRILTSVASHRLFTSSEPEPEPEPDGLSSELSHRD